MMPTSARREADWSQRYRPLRLEDCILPVRITQPWQRMVQVGAIDNLLLHGGFGVGKTTTKVAPIVKTIFRAQ